MNELEEILYKALVKVAPMLDTNELSALCFQCGFSYRDVLKDSLLTQKERVNA